MNKNNDEININISTKKYKKQNNENPYIKIKIELFINNELKEGFVSVSDLFFDLINQGYNIGNYKLKNKKSYYQNKESNFYPITCSCGDPYCAGYYNGIFSKHKEKSIEWRTVIEDGYPNFKRYYNFNKKQYINEIYSAWLAINEIIKNADYINKSFIESDYEIDSEKENNYHIEFYKDHNINSDAIKRVYFYSNENYEKISNYMNDKLKKGFL